MDLAREFLTVYGPLGLGWVGFGLCLLFLARNYGRMIESQIRVAKAIESLEKWVREALR